MMKICLIEIYIQKWKEKIIELELSIGEYIDVTLGINYAQGFECNVDIYSVDVDDVAPPKVYLSHVKCHAYCCLIFYQIKIYILVFIK